MTNILTAAQAANFIRTDTGDVIMLQLLTLVDQYIIDATGHDWRADNPIYPTAITAAGVLITYWYDTPTALGTAPASLTKTLLQLEAEALKYRKYQFAGGSAAGAIALAGARKGDVVKSIIGVYGDSGSQSAKFESIVSVDGQLQQIDGSDLSDNLYVVVLKHPVDDVGA